MQHAWIASVVLVAAALVPAMVTGQDEGHYRSPWRTPWTYEEADHWSELDPLYAACKGEAQSPIDIRNPQKAHLPPLQMAFEETPLRYVVNNGHTIRVNYARDAGSGNVLTVGDERYTLAQFHFHHPSEEQIDGKAAEMEAHFMYQAADGALAGVAVFIQEGAASDTLQKLWQHMPRAEGQIAVTGVLIDPADLAPRKSGYYRYSGSQTAPPCTEPVTWFVLKTPVYASAAQIREFAKLFPHNVRPVQPLNGRIVSETEY